jgi:hypothetical protein
MKVVKNCSTLEEAYLTRNFLENEGIASDILDEATASTAPYLLNASGIRLTVADEDAATARQLLGLPPLEETQRRGFQTVPGWLIFSVIAVALFSLFATSFSGKSTNRSSTTLSDEQDRNRDGRIDDRYEFDEAGNLKQSYEDNNFDGKWDARFQFQNRLIAKSERDLDFDGTFDAVMVWELGIPKSETITPGGTGHPLFRWDYRAGVIETKWEDHNRDGAWDAVITYDAMGREIERKALREK